MSPRTGSVMRPLAELDAAPVAAVLVDIDDTLTTHGRLDVQAYAALQRLQDAGKIVVPVTGRPAGWCDHIARMWPVDAVIGENGAFYFHYTRGRMHRRFADDARTRMRQRARLQAIAGRIIAAVPGCAVSADQAYRESDLAIDYCEDVPPLPLSAADRIAALMRSEGLSARISSIHVNGWFGRHDKLKAARRLFAELFEPLTSRNNLTVVFAGDSPNDAPMFRFFRNSVGVENVRRFGSRLRHPPAFVTQAACGAGFAELAAHLLSARTAPEP